MNLETLAIIAAAAFATSILSASIGMAGGIVLPSVMLVFRDPLEAIPLHDAVQLGIARATDTLPPVAAPPPGDTRTQ